MGWGMVNLVEIGEGSEEPTGEIKGFSAVSWFFEVKVVGFLLLKWLIYLV